MEGAIVPIRGVMGQAAQSACANQPKFSIFRQRI